MSRGCVRILDTNYVDIELLANSSVSSEQTSFPVTNAYNLQRRSKVWRSEGYFNVTALNSDIVFNDGSGNVTASIAVAEYDSTSSFMAAIDAALESAGVANYTITQNTNFKFVISSDLSGGATVFELITTDAGFTAAEMLGFDILTDKTGASSYTADVLIISTGEFIRWDMGISSLPSAFSMIGPRNKPLKLSPSGTFTLKGNFTNNFTNPYYSQVLSYDDEVIAVMSETTLADTGLRYWQVEFEDQNPNGYVEVGAFFLGTYFSPIRGRVNFPFVSQYVDRSQTIFSEGGQTYADIFEQSQKYNIVWNGLQKEDIEDITEIFRVYGVAKPFFISFDSSAAFSDEFNRFLKFVKFQEEPSFRLVSPNNFVCEMTLREEL